MSRRRYAVVGAGAVGGICGGHLERAGLEVHWLVRNEAERLRRDGLILQMPSGPLDITPTSVHTDPGALPPVDVVLVCTKTTANTSLPALLRSILGPEGHVVLLQNGLDMEIDVLGAGHDVIIGICHLAALTEKPGHIRCSQLERVILGRANDAGAPDEGLRSIALDFRHAGLPVALSDDIRRAQWVKLLWNIPFNPLSVLHDAMPHELAGNPSTRAHIERLMREVARIAKADGRPLPERLIAATIDETARMDPLPTSMHQDHQRRRPLEIESILGAPLKLAERLGVETPELRALSERMREI